VRVELRDGDLEQLRRQMATEKSAVGRDRCRVVLLAGGPPDGVELTREQIAAAVHRSRQFVDEWVRRYRKSGQAGLTAGKARGRASSLTPEQKRAFKARMLAGPTGADGGKTTLRGGDAKRILENEFGKPLKLSTVYKLMHEVGLSCLRPRPKHRKNDPEKMQQWLDRAPFLSRK
jgi:transposase